jgi:hypothetical protein
LKDLRSTWKICSSGSSLTHTLLVRSSWKISDLHERSAPAGQAWPTPCWLDLVERSQIYMKDLRPAGQAWPKFSLLDQICVLQLEITKLFSSFGKVVLALTCSVSVRFAFTLLTYFKVKWALAQSYLKLSRVSSKEQPINRVLNSKQMSRVLQIVNYFLVEARNIIWILIQVDCCLLVILGSVFWFSLSITLFLCRTGWIHLWRFGLYLTNMLCFTGISSFALFRVAFRRVSVSTRIVMVAM